MMRVERLRSLEAVEGLRAEWDRLAGVYPCRRWAWLRSWWEAYGGGRELYVLAVWDGRERLAALLPLCRSYSLAAGWCLELMGAGKACSDDMSVLVAEDEVAPAGRALGSWLLEQRGPDRWDTLDWQGIAQGDSAIGRVVEALEAGGAAVARKPDQACWRIELPTSWEAYVSGVSKRCRRLLKNSARRLASGGDARYVVAETAEHVERSYALISRMHQRRWQRVGIDGCFASRGFDRFLHAAVARYREEGALHMAVAEIGGRPVAGSIGFVLGGAHSVYLAAMDPDYAEAKPGWLLNAGHLLAAFERGHRQIDFLRGDEPYKARLGATPRAQVHLRGAAPGPVDRWRHRLWCAQSYLRGLPGRRRWEVVKIAAGRP